MTRHKDAEKRAFSNQAWPGNEEGSVAERRKEMTTQNRWTKKWTQRLATLVLAIAATTLGLGKAFASQQTTAYLNIDVTVSAQLSVEVNSLATSTQTVAWSVTSSSMVSPSSATVTNNSTGLSERWELSTNPTSLDQGSNGSWNLQTSTTGSIGQDQFALQAVFGSTNTVAGAAGSAPGACPSVSSTDWNQSFAPAVTTSLVSYSSTTFADSSLDISGASANPDCTSAGGSCVANGDMFANDYRALCWRVLGPSSVSSTDNQIVQVIVTAALP